MLKKISILLLLTIVAFTYSKELIFSFNENTQIYSFEGEDLEPESFSIDSLESSPEVKVLNLYGNCWKYIELEPIGLDSEKVWSIDILSENISDIQGVGFSDGDSTLFYSFYGSEEVDPEIWIPDYQGGFPHGDWQTFRFPIGFDWASKYGEVGEISEIIFINDSDYDSGEILFGSIYDISDQLPTPFTLDISYEIINKSREVNFNITTTPPQFDCQFKWYFGDGSISTEQSPTHIYTDVSEDQYSIVAVATTFNGYQAIEDTTITLEQGVADLPVTINFVGDIMLARGYEGYNGIIPTHGVDYIFEPTKELLGEGADITIANLESPLTTSTDQHPTKTICFKGSPTNGVGLKNGGIEIVSLANNHILDFMEDGIIETKTVLDSNGIAYGGAGLDSYEASRPVFFTKKGISYGVLFSSDRTGQYNNYQPYLQAGIGKSGFYLMNQQNVKKQIDEIRGSVDNVIVNLHSGSEYSTGPSSNYDFGELVEDEFYQSNYIEPETADQAMRYSFIDNGADLVISHHPHIIQGFESYKGKLIAHSLGNYIFDLSYLETMNSMILYSHSDRDGFSRFFVKPIFIDHYIPRLATKDLSTHILNLLAKRSSELNTTMVIDYQLGEGEIILDPQTLSPTYSNNQIYYTPVVGDSSYSQPISIDKAGRFHKLINVENGETEFRVGEESFYFGGFEDNGSNLWEVDGVATQFSPISHNGERSLKIEVEGNSSETISFDSKVKLYQKGKGSLHCFLKGAGEAEIEINFYQSRYSGYPVATEKIEIDHPSQLHYKAHSLDIDIPDNGNFYSISLTLTNSSEEKVIAYFDDIGFTIWESWEEISDREFITPNNYSYIQLKSPEIYQQGRVTIGYKEYIQPSSIDKTTPRSTIVAKNYPNPFNPSTTIEFSLAKPSTISASIYNSLGQRVYSFSKRELKSGDHTLNWSGTTQNGVECSSGLYFFRVDDGNSFGVRKMMLIR